jgi:hypothetical protein
MDFSKLLLIFSKSCFEAALFFAAIILGYFVATGQPTFTPLGFYMLLFIIISSICMKTTLEYFLSRQ